MRGRGGGDSGFWCEGGLERFGRLKSGWERLELGLRKGGVNISETKRRKNSFRIQSRCICNARKYIPKDVKLHGSLKSITLPFTSSHPKPPPPNSTAPHSRP